ncbi:MAG: carbohydrate binding family 9 domain-containing protein, partial [Woeseiaceae bacterium]|nr:carbohydrate binding family 9 domain-containing protein [Woeseiaceae bacterium]
MPYLRALCCIAASAALLSSAVRADVIELPSTTREIRIDGVLEESEWTDATRVSIAYETEPNENIPARVPTTAYVVENGESLFVAFDARDPDPDAIRAFLRDRDAAWDDDYVGIILDTYGDERRAFEFYANPLGVQMDLTRDDVNGNEDWSWNAIWDSAGRINEGGFVVEMEIPLSQLRFTQRDGAQEWSVDLGRSYPRDQSYWLSNNPNDRNINCYLC